MVGPPAVDDEVELISGWAQPKSGDPGTVEEPDLQTVAEYLTAFYHGISVKVIPAGRLTFTAWENKEDKPAKSKKRKRKRPDVAALDFIGLSTSTDCTRIGTRKGHDALYTRQLNLNDLLDAAANMLPEDAYALLMLVRQDIFEDENDDFACGRAYGGSR